MSALNDDDKIIEGVGVTPRELRAEAERRKARLESHRPHPTLSREHIEQFHAHLEKLGKAKNKSEQNYISTQEALKQILNPLVKVFVDDLGAKAYLKIGSDNIAKQTTEAWIVQFVAKPLEDRGLYLKNKDIHEHIRTWSDKADKIPEIPSSFTVSETELTFCRIKLLLEDGETPTWDHFISRCGSNGEPLMAFIWSLLNKDDKSQQYLLLKGDGEDGKGSLIRWLSKLFNDQLVGLSVTDKWPALCVGRRIGVFNDINNTAIVMTSQFKQITGGDKVSIEQKYEKTFSVTLDTKFILTTNRAVNIIGAREQRRRAILVELNGDRVFIEDYEEKLEAEGSAFLSKCKSAYEKLYDKNRKTIKCNYEFFESESDSYEEQYEALFAKCFTLSPEKSCNATDFHNRLVKEIGHDNNSIGAFKEWLERTHKVKRSRLSIEKRPSVYKGIVIRP